MNPPFSFSLRRCLSLPAAAAVLLGWLLGCSSGQPPSSSIEVAVKGAQAAAVSADGEYASIGSIHHGGSLWRLRDGERLYDWNHKAGEQTTIIASDFSADGRWALTADVYTMVLWSLQDGQATRYWNAPGEILSVALSANGEFALLGLADHTAVLFDIQRGGIKRTFHLKNRVRSVALSDNSRLALTGSEDYSATLWDVASGNPLQQIMHDDDVQMVALSGDGELALSAAKYDKALLWHTRSGKVIGEVPLAAEKLNRGIRFTAASFSQDGKLLLTGRPDQTVQLWDTRSLKQLQRWQLPKRDAWKPTGAAVLAVGFGKNANHYIAVASDGFVHRLTGG
ncbi:MAG: hypothetical protein GYB33_17680 [Gammaproteobacteria bacterium]|nr:hypothetical protein [Gammaproteobacteria bacterium]